MHFHYTIIHKKYIMMLGPKVYSNACLHANLCINQGGTAMNKKIFCNVCGRQLHMENDILLEDAFEARKQWGYFSRKDTTLHSFVICEKCYDEMVKKFVIPPEVTNVTEL